MLPEPASLALFMAASALLLVTPGPAVLFTVARSLDHGRLAGVISSIGLCIGGLCHVTLEARPETAFSRAAVLQDQYLSL